MKKHHYAMFSLFVIAGFFAVTMAAYSVTPAIAPQVNSQHVKYDAGSCVYHNDFLGYDEDGNAQYETILKGCSHNLLYNEGQNMTRDSLGIGGNSILNITLANCSASCGVPSAGADEAFTALAGCGMLSAEGTYALVPTSGGNWSVSKTFTSTCENVVTNLTRIGNASGSYLAGNTFNFVNLSTNDQLTVNWTIMITSG